MAFHRRHRPGVTAWSPHPRPRRPSRRRTPRPPRRRPSSCRCLHRHPTPFSLSHSTRQQDECNRRSRRSAGAGRDRRQKVWTRTGPSRSWNEPTGMSSPCGSRSWFPAHREQTVGPRQPMGMPPRWTHPSPKSPGISFRQPMFSSHRATGDHLEGVLVAVSSPAGAASFNWRSRIGRPLP